MFNLQTTSSKIITSFNVLFLLHTNSFCYVTEEDPEKLKKFQKSMGKPNMYFNQEGLLVLLVTIYNGDSNRVIDSGINSVGIQLKDIDGEDCGEINSNLIRFLSQVLQLNEGFFTITQGSKPLEKVVTIHQDKVEPYALIDKLVAALVITAKEDPSALKKVYSRSQETKNSKENILSEEDSIRIFDWRNETFS